MQRINLLYVITKLELGGAQKQLLSLISHLSQERFRIFLFTAREGLLLPEALSINGLTLKKSRCLERAINPIKDLLALIEIYWFIKKNNIKVVHTHSSKAGILGRLAARLAKTKIIIHTVHGWSFNDYQPKLVKIAFVWLERLTAQFTHKIIVVTHHDKQKGLGNHIGNEDKYQIIRYGIDYAEFDNIIAQELKKKLGIEDNVLVVGMIACFKPQKSPQDFVKLAFLIKKNQLKAKFILIGDGILRKKTEGLICKLGLQRDIILAGWRCDIPRTLSIMDIFVLTSLWEGLPIAALEAMASAKPVVATDTGGIQELIIEGKTGFFAPPGDMLRMSERLSFLLRNEQQRRQMGQEARKSLGFDFNLAHMVENTENLYSDLLERYGWLNAH